MQEKEELFKCPKCKGTKFERKAEDTVKITVDNIFGYTDELIGEEANFEYKCKNCGFLFADFEIDHYKEKAEKEGQN